MIRVGLGLLMDELCLRSGGTYIFMDETLIIMKNDITADHNKKRILFQIKL